MVLWNMNKLNAGENVPNPKTLGAFLGHFLGVSGPGSTTIVLLIKFCNFQEKFGQESSPRLINIFPLKFEETFTPG